jgi:short-subunit dehydrogenase
MLEGDLMIDYEHDDEVPVYVISVAAQLAGLHPQTLRQYDRLGLVSPGRSVGRNRLYSLKDIQRLREVTKLSNEGVTLSGIMRILILEEQLEKALKENIRLREAMGPSTAVITGASVGIGASYAKQLAATGSDLVLVARDVTRLEALAAELKSAHGVQVEVLQADLSDRAQLDKVCVRVAQSDIDLLVNNAGFGIKQPFVGGTIEAEQNLLDVLVTAVMRITHAAMPGMIARDRGGIINVSSVAGWMSSGTYSSAKAWVTSFSEALATQHKKANVHVLALCPGYTRTEFHSRANMETETIPNWMWLDVDAVVAKSLKDFEKGKPISVPGMQYKFLSLVAQYLPRPIVRKLSVASRR